MVWAMSPTEVLAFQPRELSSSIATLSFCPHVAFSNAFPGRGCSAEKPQGSWGTPGLRHRVEHPCFGDWGRGRVLRCFWPRPQVGQADSAEWRSFSFQGRVRGEVPLKQEPGIPGLPCRSLGSGPTRLLKGHRRTLGLSITSFLTLPAGGRGVLLLLGTFSAARHNPGHGGQ